MKITLANTDMTINAKNCFGEIVEIAKLILLSNKSGQAHATTDSTTDAVVTDSNAMFSLAVFFIIVVMNIDKFKIDSMKELSIVFLFEEFNDMQLTLFVNYLISDKFPVVG